MTRRFYAPSQYHMNLMERTAREFAWRGQDFETWQDGLRERLRELIGVMPEKKTPLDVQELEKEEAEDHVRIKLVFRAEEAADVPAQLLVPRGVDGPVPAMICLQGHSPGMHISLGVARDEHEEELVAGDRDYALQAVRQGFVALAVEQRCFGERAETELDLRWEHTCVDAVVHSLMMGKTLIGERVWDVMRALDLLEELPEVDPERMMCMGNSGGGTVTFYAACLDPRIRLAVPSCCYCTYAASIMRIKHCPDNCIPGILRVAEMGEVAGLIAPRGLVLVAAEEDPIFPLHGIKEAFETTRQIFTAAGCPDHARLVVGPAGHRFYANLAWPVIKRTLAELS